MPVKISGFSYIRNGFELGYPFLEAFKSILPICDEFVVAVGDSDDNTREAIAQLDEKKIKIVDTVWDMKLRKDGKIFAQQTNIALDNIKGDWAFHIQADEVIHENDLPKITEVIDLYKEDKNIDGFILPFLHFWGSYDFIRNTRRIHLYEVRIFRNDKLVRSYRDSQGFRKYSSVKAYELGEVGEKLRVKKINAVVYHYNGVRNVNVQKKKMHMFDLLHGEDKSLEENAYENFDYQNIDRVVPFKGSHPKVMEERIKGQNWEFEFDPKKSVWKLKDRIMQPIEDLLGFKIGEYKNYKLLK
jgi:glycosyltransferase involved in cell wall biosynthesis